MGLLATVLTPLGALLRSRRAGEEYSVRNNPNLVAPDTLVVRSRSFAEGGEIPNRHASMDLGPNMSPPISIGSVPDGARSLLLIIEDTDVPSAKPRLHTIALLPSDLAEIPEGALTPDAEGVVYVPTHRGRRGYLGPRPLPGHGIHHYGFHVFALDIERVPDKALVSIETLIPTLEGRVIARGTLNGIKRG